MNIIVLFLAVVSVIAANDTLVDKWHSWKTQYRRVYTSEKEEEYRKQTWLNNLHKISHLNSYNHTFVMQLNQYSDLVSFQHTLVIYHCM